MDIKTGDYVFVDYPSELWNGIHKILKITENGVITSANGEDGKLEGLFFFKNIRKLTTEEREKIIIEVL